MEELKSAAVMETDQWMNYLRNSNVNVFEIIKSVITVAASDHPKEFRNNRDMIAQTLFSCDLINCSGCKNCKKEDETTTLAQVFNMKQILHESNSSRESEPVLLESLSRLQQMVKSVDVLKANGVGRSVNALKNHTSKRVVEASRSLVKEWKRMVDESLLKDTENMQQQKVDESERNPRNVTQQDNKKQSLIVRIKLKKKPTDGSEIIKQSVNGPVTPELKDVESKNPNYVADRVLRIKAVIDDERVSESVVLESLMKLQNVGLSVETLRATGIGKSVRVLVQKHGSKDVRQIAWGLVKEWNRKNESSLKTERKREKKDAGIEEKLKATKRKLQEAYEEAENMKKKRRIQVIELHQFTDKLGFSSQIKPRKRQTIRR